MFNNLKAIKFLYLDNNNISSVEKGTFVHNWVLQVLSLRGNKITEITVNLKFIGMQGEVLDKMKDLSLSDIDSPPFYSKYLMAYTDPSSMGFHLVLSKNDISDIPNKTFNHLFALTKLDLSHNKLYCISKDTLVDQKGLKSLLLTGNKFQNLYVFMFKDLQEIRLINLDRNNIYYMQKGTFICNNKLIVLSLKGNRVINPYQFSELSHPYSNLKNVSVCIKRKITKPRIKRTEWDVFRSVMSWTIQKPSFKKIEVNNMGKILYLSESALKYAIPDLLNVMPSLKILHMDNMSLFHLPTDLFYHASISSLVELSVQNNNITSLHYGDFSKLLLLEILNLAHNNFLTTDGRNFLGLKLLKCLNLCCNSLNNVQNLKSLSSLLSLNLSYNILSEIDTDIFQGLWLLESLDNSNNLIFKIDPLAFANNKLKYLNLAHNKIISFIAINGFSQLQFLEILDISHNGLATVDCGTFVGLQALEYLNICCNLLEHLTKFYGLSSLLSLNLISKISRDIFTELKSISNLDLSSNLIIEIELGAFSQKTLKILNLSHNKIVFILWNIFVDSYFNPNDTAFNSLFSGVVYRNNADFVKVKFNGNNLTCSRETCWLKDGIRENWIRTDVELGCWENCPNSGTVKILILFLFTCLFSAFHTYDQHILISEWCIFNDINSCRQMCR